MNKIKAKPESYKRYEKYRNKAKMNDCQVSKASGVQSATIYSWKAGLYEPKLEKKIKIAKCLGISLEELVGVV